MAGIHFNADEIFQLAMQIERNGAKFYRKAAATIAQPRFKELLLELAKMEDHHEQAFAKIRASFQKADDRSWIQADPDDLAGSYLRSLTNGQVFDYGKDPSLMLNGGESMREILQIAIGLEKDSIIFYVGLKEKVPENMGRNNIDAIISEEMKHITSLSELLAELGGQSHS